MNLIETTEYKEVLAELKKAALLGELSLVEKIAEQLENVLQNILEVNVKCDSQFQNLNLIQQPIF